MLVRKPKLRTKDLILLLLGALLFNVSFSQDNYVPAYIIKNNQDTLRGFVDYRNKEVNPSKIKFKTNIDDSPVYYTPTDINEFGVEDEIYVSGIINTEVTPFRIDELGTDPQIKIEVDTAFLQANFRGKKELYYYKNEDGKENFYIKKGADFELLIYKKYLKTHNGKNVIVENKNYLGQLILYLEDCSDIQTKISGTLYKQKSLNSLFQYYYECSQNDISFQQKRKKHNQLGFLIGSSLTSLKFSSKNFSYLINTDYSQSTSISTGLFFDLILPSNQGKWSINNELLFSTYHVKGEYEEFENENDYSMIATEFGYSYLKINNLLRFKYPLGHTFLYFNAGMSNGFAISVTNYKKEETKYYSRETLVEEPAIDKTRKYEQGYLLGIGIKYNKFSFEIRYEKGNGMSGYKTLVSATNRYYFLLGYRFK